MITISYFYFDQEENDNDYESESSGHDSIDTDFADTEEEDEEDDGSANDVFDDEKRKRRSRRVVTKSYKVVSSIRITANRRSAHKDLSSLNCNFQEPKAKKETGEKTKSEPRSRGRIATSAATIEDESSAEAIGGEFILATSVN